MTDRRPMVLDLHQIKRLYPKATQSRRLVIGDHRLMVPTVEWVVDILRPWWARHLEELKERRRRSRANSKDLYILRRHDCENFAMRLKVLVDEMHATTPVPEELEADLLETGLSFGVFFYMIAGDPARGHAINTCPAMDGDTLRTLYLEPQAPASPESFVLNLTPTEIESCYFTYI